MNEGHVVSINIAPRGLPMRAVSEVRAVAGKGLEGDRYFDGTGTYSAKVDPAHEVTLIEAEAVEALRRETGLELPMGQTRRNVVTRAVALNHFVGREFTVGELRLRGHRLCEPCGHMERLVGLKGARAGLVHRGGLRCQILTGGILRVGDVIRACEPAAAPAAPPQNTASAPGAAAEAKRPPGPVVLKRFEGPRPDATSVAGMLFCLVPAGKFILGSQNDPLTWEDEGPQQTYDLPYDFWLARYPVSNAQFLEFAKAGGYLEPDFWKEAAASKVWKAGLLKNRVAEEAQVAPADFGEPLNRPDHPVIAPTWYEALAFCRWLNGRLAAESALPDGWEVRLPSECEWEKAARGGLEIPKAPVMAKPAELKRAGRSPLQENPQPKRRFPWGNDPDPARANYLDTGLGATSPVGSFPDGASPYGVEDLSGNVWEWMRNQYETYPYPDTPAGRAKLEALAAPGLRALRGGGFGYHVALVRCSARHTEKALARYRHIGFRVALGPAAVSASDYARG